jgi:hypothetical protein
MSSDLHNSAAILSFRNELRSSRLCGPARHLLARGVDDRAKHTLAVEPSILLTTPGPSVGAYQKVVIGRVAALGDSSSLHQLGQEI